MTGRSLTRSSFSVTKPINVYVIDDLGIASCIVGADTNYIGEVVVVSIGVGAVIVRIRISIQLSRNFSFSTLGAVLL